MFFFLCSNQHFSSTHTGTEITDDGTSEGPLPQDSEEEDPGDNKTESSVKSRTFKEAAAPSRHFEEKPPSLLNSFKKPRSFKELPPTNGEVGKTEESSASGKWESLHVASTLLEKPSPSVGIKEPSTAAKETKPVFAHPTLRPKDMDMPPPKLPGRSLLMKSENNCGRLGASGCVWVWVTATTIGQVPEMTINWWRLLKGGVNYLSNYLSN